MEREESVDSSRMTVASLFPRFEGNYIESLERDFIKNRRQMSRASKDFNSLPRLFTIIGFIDEFDHASLLLLPPPIDIISVQRPNITGAFYFIFFFQYCFYKRREGRMAGNHCRPLLVFGDSSLLGGGR